MHIVFDVLGTLPLVDVQTGRRGKQDRRIEKIQLGKCAVAFTDELSLQMREIRTGKAGIVLGSRHIDHVKTAGIQFAYDRQEYRPVALIVGEDGERDRFGIDGGLLAAADQKAEFDPQALQKIEEYSDQSDDYGEKHTSRAGIDI